jgi:uroporphyrin-3 C-methyltransferase
VNIEIPESENRPEKTSEADPDSPAAEQEAPADIPAEPEKPEKSAESDRKQAPAAAESSRKGGGLAVLAFLFALAALVGTGWMWWQDQSALGLEQEQVFREIARLESRDSELSLKLDQVRNELEATASGDVSADVEAMERRLRADRAKLADVEQAIEEQLAVSRSLQAATDSMHGRLQAAEAAVTGMSTRELDAGGELDLAEVDYLLRLANERLKLFSDPAAADQALELADMHLAALDNPMYLGVRQDIAAARREIAALELPDFLGIANQLDQAQQMIPSLVFPEDSPQTPPGAPEAEEGWWAKLKGVFSNLVTVRRSTEEESQRISLQDKDFIRQRLWTQLEVAHLALMRHDQQAFRTSLERARETLSAWFEESDRHYQALNADIEKLLAVDIAVSVPDITAPWSTLRSLRGARRSTPVPSAPETESAGDQPEIREQG